MNQCVVGPPQLVGKGPLMYGFLWAANLNRDYLNLSTYDSEI